MENIRENQVSNKSFGANSLEESIAESATSFRGTEQILDASFHLLLGDQLFGY